MPDHVADIVNAVVLRVSPCRPSRRKSRSAVPSNTRPLPSSSRSLSLAVTTATLAPAFWNASKIVGARSHLGSFIIVSRPGLRVDEIVAADAVHRRRPAGDDRQIVGIGEARHRAKAAAVLALGDHPRRDWASALRAGDFHIVRLAAIAADDHQRRLRPGIGAAVHGSPVFDLYHSLVELLIHFLKRASGRMSVTSISSSTSRMARSAPLHDRLIDLADRADPEAWPLGQLCPDRWQSRAPAAPRRTARNRNWGRAA